MFVLFPLFSPSILWISSFKGSRRTDLRGRMTVLSRNMPAQCCGNWLWELVVGICSSLKLGLLLLVHECSVGLRSFVLLYCVFSFQQKKSGASTICQALSTIKRITIAYLVLPLKIQRPEREPVITVLEPAIHGLELCILWPVLSTYMEWFFPKYSCRSVSSKENS